jgi:hypothetical protein
MNVLTKTIWGESSVRASEEEPVSGKQGGGTASDPYDKGNEEVQQGEARSPAVRGHSQRSVEEDAKNANAAAAASASSVSATQRDGPSDATEHTGDPTSGAQPTQKQQGADRPAEAPDSSAPSIKDQSKADKKSGKPAMPHTDTEREELMKTGEFPHDPEDHSGEPMHMHVSPTDNKSSSAEPDRGDGKTSRSASVAQEGGAPHGKTLGTGQQYVKSSGVAAEGGDFDATKPGAGQEATRKI